MGSPPRARGSLSLMGGVLLGLSAVPAAVGSLRRSRRFSTLSWVYPRYGGVRLRSRPDQLAQLLGWSPAAAGSWRSPLLGCRWDRNAPQRRAPSRPPVGDAYGFRRRSPALLAGAASDAYRAGVPSVRWRIWTCSWCHATSPLSSSSTRRSLFRALAMTAAAMRLRREVTYCRVHLGRNAARSLASGTRDDVAALPFRGLAGRGPARPPVPHDADSRSRS